MRPPERLALLFGVGAGVSARQTPGETPGARSRRDVGAPPGIRYVRVVTATLGWFAWLLLATFTYMSTCDVGNQVTNAVGSITLDSRDGFPDWYALGLPQPPPGPMMLNLPWLINLAGFALSCGLAGTGLLRSLRSTNAVVGIASVALTLLMALMISTLRQDYFYFDSAKAQLACVGTAAIGLVLVGASHLLQPKNP